MCESIFQLYWQKCGRVLSGIKLELTNSLDYKANRTYCAFYILPSAIFASDLHLSENALAASELLAKCVRSCKRAIRLDLHAS